MCSKCFVSKEQMAGRAIGANIKGFTDTAKRDPYLLQEPHPINVGGWLWLVAIVLVFGLVFGKPILKMMGA